VASILGGEDAKTTGKATVFGAVSSACTFGAVTITQTLFEKGASPHSSFAFSFASTNLVFELGILIYVLLGWAFLAAELLGGFVLITIVYALVRLTLPRATFDEARRRLRDGSKTKSHSSGGDWKQELRRRRGWHLVALNYFQTMRRIWRSVVFGFLPAGFVVGLVPSSVWAGVFPSDETFFGVVANTLIGVAIGVLSFIGSIGNVPFAAALWISGASFGGVIALIYADLITVPVMNLWRRCFGWKAAAYIFAVFFVTMAGSAVLMQYLFDVAGWIPERTAKQAILGFDFSLNLTWVMTARDAVRHRGPVVGAPPPRHAAGPATLLTFRMPFSSHQRLDASQAERAGIPGRWA
jgi:uncharacterized membrane protein YraQ (UPF0718 family)